MPLPKGFTLEQPDIRTGAVAGPQPRYYAQGVSNPPNGGQITDVDNPEPNDAISLPKGFILEQPPIAGLSGALPAQPKAPVPTALQGPRSVLRNFASAAGDVSLPVGDAGIGALKGAGSTLDNIGNVATLGLTSRPALRFYNQHLGTDFNVPTPEQENAPFQANGTAQSVGKGIEQAGEFLIPGLGEDAAAAKAGKFAPLARLGYNALTSGALNKLQGGGFDEGAAMGAGGAVVSEAGHAVAPLITEFAQGIYTPGARTGKAILDETSSIFPDAVRRSARSVLDRLNPEMQNAVDAASGLVPLAPAQQVADDNVARAFGRNEPKMYSGAKRLRRIVTTDLDGNPLPPQVPASQALELRRGVDTALPPGSFNPQSTNAFKGYRTPLRDALNEGIGNVVPEYRPLATRISNLIPATKPAKRGFGHLWGPGAGAIFGGYYGARAGARNEGGLPGAIKGGLMGATEGATAGTVLPAFLNGSARTLYSPVMRRLIVPLSVGGALQMTRQNTR